LASDPRNQIEAGGKTDRGVWSFPAGDRETGGSYDFCCFEGDKEKGRRQFNLVNNLLYARTRELFKILLLDDRFGLISRNILMVRMANSAVTS